MHRNSRSSMSDWPIPTKRSLKWRFLSTLTLKMVGATSKFWLQYLNQFKCHNKETLLNLIKNREPGRALITVANHDSCLDDPLAVSGPLPMRLFKSEKCRWSLGAKEICHTTPIQTKFFCWGQVIPVVRGDGIYQKAMEFALQELKKGCWLHLYPEGRVNEKKEIIRYKWGVGRLIMDLDIPPIVLPCYHFGMDDVLPNKSPYRPQIGKKVTMLIGTPISFEDLLKKLKAEQKSAAEIRKILTDKIQEEMYKLKALAEQFHEKHLAGIN